MLKVLRESSYKSELSESAWLYICTAVPDFFIHLFVERFASPSAGETKIKMPICVCAVLMCRGWLAMLFEKAQ